MDKAKPVSKAKRVGDNEETLPGSEVVNVAAAGLRRPCCFLCWLMNRKTHVPPVTAPPACFPFWSIPPLPSDMADGCVSGLSPFVSHVSVLVLLLCFTGESEFLLYTILKRQTGVCKGRDSSSRQVLPALGCFLSCPVTFQR